MFSSCIQYFVALSLLILRIRFQTILRIFLLKYPIYQVISIFIYYLFLFFNKASFYLTTNQRYPSFFHPLCDCLLTTITTRIYPSDLQKCIFSRINKSNIVQTKTSTKPEFCTQKTPFLSRKPAKGRVQNSISCCRTNHSMFVPAKPVPAAIQYNTSSTFERRAVISSSQRST